MTHRIKILNLFSGVGGNRKQWHFADVHAVEQDPAIAEVYLQNFPNDRLHVGCAYKYLEDNADFILDHFDFVWCSPPCQTHSQMAICGTNKSKRFVDLRLYELILFFRTYFKSTAWTVENVRPHYTPLIAPSIRIGRHFLWSNFSILPLNSEAIEVPGGNIAYQDAEVYKEHYGIHYEGNIYYGNNHNTSQVMRNCASPVLGRHVLDSLNRNGVYNNGTQEEMNYG